MWTEFEWENRVNVSCSISYAYSSSENSNGLNLLSKFSRDPREYLQHVMKVTNMACLTPDGALSGDCDFLSGNLYARSLFGESRTTIRLMALPSCRLDVTLTGEDALANLSVERTDAGTITGHVRIRSKTQGIALSLGDRITMGGS